MCIFRKSTLSINMTTTPQKDTIVFILDVNPSLWEAKSAANSGKINDKISFDWYVFNCFSSYTVG